MATDVTVTTPDEFGVRRVEHTRSDGRRGYYCVVGIALAHRVAALLRRGDEDAAWEARRASRQLPHDDVTPYLPAGHRYRRGSP